MADANEIWTNIGIGAFGFLAALYAYFSKRPAATPAAPRVTEAIVAGVGIEIGNKEQIERLIAEAKRIADGVASCAASLQALSDRKQAELDDKVDEVREQQDRLNGLMIRLEEVARRN